MQFSVLVSSIEVTYETCIWGGRTSRRSTCRDLAYSHHTALFYTQGSPPTFLALVLLARVTPRIAPHIAQSLTNEAFLLLLWQVVHGISLLTQVLLWHLLSRALGGHLVALVDLLSCCFPLVKVVFAVPFLLCTHCQCCSSSACMCTPPRSPYRNEEFRRDRRTCT